MWLTVRRKEMVDSLKPFRLQVLQELVNDVTDQCSRTDYPALVLEVRVALLLASVATNLIIEPNRPQFTGQLLVRCWSVLCAL